MTRLYGNAYYISDSQFKSGNNKIRVSLNSNNHRGFMLNGVAVEDELTIHVEGNGDHDHHGHH